MRNFVITVNGKTYTIKTNANGVATFNVKNYLTQANTYTVKYDKNAATESEYSSHEHSVGIE